MDIGGSRATVHGVTESDLTEVTGHTYMHFQKSNGENEENQKKKKKKKKKSLNPNGKGM